MKISPVLFCFVMAVLCMGWSNPWMTEKQPQYTVYYTASDQAHLAEYKPYFQTGAIQVEIFFQGAFPRTFDVYVHPSRTSLDHTWQNDWGAPDFQSQCWMVASGVANKLDILSPVTWDKLACEHSYRNPIKTQRLITHELVHVYHGQHNASPDFSDVTGIDWFVEGLAVYASGQCDAQRIAAVKEAFEEGDIPERLQDLWSGNLKYGLSGTAVMYLDQTFGREKLITLLKFNDISALLAALETSETEILEGWKAYVSEL